MGALATRNSLVNTVPDSEAPECVEQGVKPGSNDIKGNVEKFLKSQNNVIFYKQERESYEASSSLEIPKKQSGLKKNRVVLAFQAKDRPRQPFMNQPTNQPSSNNPSRLPTPPAYYRNQVTQDLHQPEQIRRASSGRGQESPPRQQTQEVRIDPRPNFQPGQLAIIPNNLINIAYWAPYPEQIPPNIPACLAHLVAADSLFVVQQVDLIEIFLNIDEPNFYLIQNKYGECVYYAYETTDICGQVCCRNSRGFQLHILDMYHNEIIYMNRPCGCSDYFCCYPVMEVYSPPLVPVGAIIQTYHPTHERFSIMDADENKMFKIRGPCFLKTCGCCAEAEFTVIHALDTDETEVGVIRREYGGLVRTFYTNADFYAITFPVDLDVRIKAAFLGALFLVSLKRTGWVLRNVEDPETVSGHMYRMSVMTLLIPETSGVDRTRCMKLSIVHDLAECIVGDLTPFCGVEPSEKHRQEDAAMKELTQMIGDNGVEIYKLYKEYEAQLTDESKFVKDLDRLDMILQAYEYEKMGDRPGKLEEFFTSTLNKFHFPWTIDLVKEIYKQRNLFVNKDKV